MAMMIVAAVEEVSLAMSVAVIDAMAVMIAGRAVIVTLTATAVVNGIAALTAVSVLAASTVTVDDSSNSGS